jgi:DUF1680 family protein
MSAAITRRTLLQQAASSTAAFALAGFTKSLLASAPIAIPKELAATALRPLPLGQVLPAGWLQRQLRIQADGLSGHLDEFWPDVGANSGWLGGTGESWERGPYFLDGLLPLAYLLDDEVLKAKAQKFVEWTLEHQRADGMIGPSNNDDWWPRMVMLKALAQYQEATGDHRVLPLMTRYFHYQLAELPKRQLTSWGKYRWQDEVQVVEWLYERTQDTLLLSLAALLQAQGYDWSAQFADFKYTTPTPLRPHKNGMGEAAMQVHGVNISQSLKVAAVQYRLSGDIGERAAFFRQLGELDKYHGVPNGMFSCDEHLAGREPQHGTELCSVVETMFSLEVVLATFGDAVVADRLEKIAYNALPGTFTDDMWAHQYNQQSNQVQVGLLSKPWTSDGPESNLYGLAPNFGCCTANYHQGWPKFTASLWMKSPDDGLVAALFAPCELHTTVRGVAVRVSESTDYPFRNMVRLTVMPEKALNFPLSFRVPGWAMNASIKINGSPSSMALNPGTFAKLERLWQPGDTIEISFPMAVRAIRGYNRSVSLERGPVVFSLDPGESWVKLRDRGMTADWQVFPKARWNYALHIDEATAPALPVSESPVGARPFAAEQASVRLRVPAKALDNWRSEDGVAPAPPLSPVSSNAPEATLTLIPYACAKLRVTAFPSLSS